MARQRHELTEEQWQRMKDLLPSDQSRGGFRPHSNRDIVNAILWILRSGAPWRDLSDRYPKWKSVHTRVLRWSKAGNWSRVLDALRWVLADKAYDSDATVAQIDSQGSTAVIPPRRGRRIERPYDRALFKSRFVVEHFFARIKRCRRIARRYDKLAVAYLAMVLIACILTWLA